MSKREKRWLKFYIFSALIFAYLIGSWFEIYNHNLEQGYEYNKYNFFVWLTANAQTTANHEMRKGRAKLPAIKKLNTDNISETDIKACIKFMQSDVGMWACEYAESNGYDKYLLVSQIYSESRFTPTITSYGGAVGLMQIIPSCSYQFMNEVGATNLFNCQDNIKTGVAIMNYYTIKRGNVRDALADYNGGLNGHRNRRCLNYADTIINRALVIQQTVEQN